MPRPCETWHAERPDCRLCWLYANDPRYRRLWGGPSPNPPPAAAKDCVHLGPALPLQPGCGCAERRRECSEFGECSLKPSKAKHHCLNADGSAACPTYEPKD